MQATGNHRIILIAGIPATGKSYFGEWLSLHHGFLHIELENALSRRSAGIYDAWDQFLDTHDASPMVSVLNEQHSDIVMDWGFPTDCLPMVVELKKVGVELWWFDGDTAAAFSQFTRRNTKPIQDFYAQVPGIRLAWSAISKVFGANCIQVLGANSPQLTCDEIWERMNGHVTIKA